MVVKFTLMALNRYFVTSFDKLQCRCSFKKNNKIYIHRFTVVDSMGALIKDKDLEPLQTANMANYLSDCTLHSFPKFSDFPTVKNRVE